MYIRVHSEYSKYIICFRIRDLVGEWETQTRSELLRWRKVGMSWE